MYVNDDSHCAGTTKVEVTSHGKERLKRKVSLENRHRGCGRDVLRQTVPGASSGNREGPITDGGQPCSTTVSVDDEVECITSANETNAACSCGSACQYAVLQTHRQTPSNTIPLLAKRRLR